MLSLTALFVFAPALTALVPRSEDWLLVRGPSEKVGTLSWQRIGEAYLAGRSWRLATPDEARREPNTSRMVVGSPGDGPEIASLAATFGASLDDGVLRRGGREYPPGTGFAVYTDDPDGAGTLFLICGADAEGVFACFQTSLNLSNGGFALARGGAVVERGMLGLVFDTTRPSVVRLDEDFTRLAARTYGSPGERSLRVARALVGYGHVFGALGVGDLLPYVHRVLADGASLARAREQFADLDLTAAVLRAYDACVDAFGAGPRPAPAFYVLFAGVDDTNAKTFDPDPVTGRPQVLFNLTALARGRHLDAALVHESVHTFQELGGRRLVDRAVVEGVASLVSQELCEDLGDADALLWSPAELEAAEERRDAIVDAFRRDANTADSSRHGHWLTLGVPLGSVPGAPSRSGYYVGWLACRAWLDADRSRELRALLRASPDEILAAL